MGPWALFVARLGNSASGVVTSGENRSTKVRVASKVKHASLSQHTSGHQRGNELLLLLSVGMHTHTHKLYDPARNAGPPSTSSRPPPGCSSMPVAHAPYFLPRGRHLVFLLLFQVFEGLPSDAVKTMEALELSQALQRVRSSRRRRKEEGGGGGRREGRRSRNNNDNAERPSGSSGREGEAVRGKGGLGEEGGEEDGSGLLGRGET